MPWPGSSPKFGSKVTKASNWPTENRNSAQWPAVRKTRLETSVPLQAMRRLVSARFASKAPAFGWRLPSNCAFPVCAGTGPAKASAAIAAVARRTTLLIGTSNLQPGPHSDLRLTFVIIQGGTIRTLDPSLPVAAALAIAGEWVVGGIRTPDKALASPAVAGPR